MRRDPGSLKRTAFRSGHYAYEYLRDSGLGPVKVVVTIEHEFVAPGFERPGGEGATIY